jgi:zinc protease
LLLTASAGAAQKPRPAVRRKSPETTALPLRSVERTLRNGLRVIVVPTKLPKVVSVHIPMKVGSRDEVDPGRSGFAHFFEHMMFRGTKKYPAERWDQLVDSMGANQNAYTTYDHTNYHTTLLARDLERLLRMEGDRFQHLDYDEEAFKTEAGAIAGEYRSRLTPYGMLGEAIERAAYSVHPYRHPVMGTPEDIAAMPDQYEYSRAFYDRFYRPERATIVVSGNVRSKRVFDLVERYFGDWQKGKDAPLAPPREPPPAHATYVHVPSPTATTPLVSVTFRVPGFSDRKVGPAAMDLATELYFGPTSELHRKLVLRERRVHGLWGNLATRRDDALLTVTAQLKDPSDAAAVRDEILRAARRATVSAPAAKDVEALRSSQRYILEAAWDSADSIASTVAQFAHHTRSLGGFERFLRRADSLTPEQILRACRRVLTDENVIVATLSHEPMDAAVSEIPRLSALEPAALPPAPPVRTAASTPAATRERTPTPADRLVLVKTELPLVNLRLEFQQGSARDPAGKEGLAALAAAMLVNAGSRLRSTEEVAEALQPIAGEFGAAMAGDRTMLSGEVHRDAWRPFVDTVLPLLTDPGFDPLDFERIKSSRVEQLERGPARMPGVALASARLSTNLLGGAYGHPVLGTVEGVRSITLGDVKAFVASAYQRGALTVGLAGDVRPEMVAHLDAWLSALPKGDSATHEPPAPLAPPRTDGRPRVEIVEKAGEGTAISIGTRLPVERKSDDYAALLVATDWLGGGSTGQLFQKIRSERGLSYGAYASMECGRTGTFSIQVDAVAPENAPMTLRIVLDELGRLVEHGLDERSLGRVRRSILKQLDYVNPQGAELDRALSERRLDLANSRADLRARLRRVTVEDVRAALARHLARKELDVVMVAPDANRLREELLADRAGTLRYDAPKGRSVLREDARIAKRSLELRPEEVRVTQLDELYRR